MIKTPEQLISEYWNQRNRLEKYNRYPKTIFISINLIGMFRHWDTSGPKELTARTAGLHVDQNTMFGFPFLQVVEKDIFKLVD